jgi:hypothetical protein
MTGIDCRGFATLLADLLENPPSAPSDPRAAALREHALRCPECAGSAALIALAAAPREQRDPIEDPGPAYWDDFGRRLDERLRPERPRGRLVALAAAAVAAGAILWVALSRHAGVPVAIRPPAPETFPSATALPPETLDDAGATDDDASAAFGGAEPLDAYTDDDAAGLFPALDELSPAEARRLLLWLEEEEGRVKRGET